jgi:7-carboxy-7-deazaguanine synthase
MLPVIEMFHSIQGEGEMQGVPSFFIRVSGCNLRCVFKNTICDTPFSSFKPEKGLYDSMEHLVMEFNKLRKQHPNTNHIVITGGEPMLYQDLLVEFLSQLDEEEYFHTTIETNGSLAITNDELTDFVDLWSISPKLSTSVDHDCKFLTEEQRDRHDKARINIDNLAAYLNSWCTNTQLKFVYSGEDSVKEIKDILNKLDDYVDEPDLNDLVMLMPEATTQDHLKEKQLECAEVCMKEGWRFCDRLHIRVWGDKRGV